MRKGDTKVEIAKKGGGGRAKRQRAIESERERPEGEEKKGAQQIRASSILCELLHRDTDRDKRQKESS